MHFSVPLNHTGQFHITIMNEKFNLFIKENCLDSKKYKWMYLNLAAEEMSPGHSFMATDVTLGGEVRAAD